MSDQRDIWLLSHFTTWDTLFKILDSGELWLGPYAKTNDPREAKEWVAEVVVDATSGEHASNLAADVRRLADPLLRGGARLACFTQDRPKRDGAAPGSLFHRAWANAPMWDRYGEEHHGACLVFARDLMVGQVFDEREVRDGDLYSCGEVVYSDEPLDVVIDLVKIDTSDAKNVLDEYQAQRGVAGPLYFTKNTDWSYESEFRIVVVRWDLPAEQIEAPVQVPFGPALQGVILGEAFPQEGLDRVRRAIGRYPRVELLQARWERGVPSLRVVE